MRLGMGIGRGTKKKKCENHGHVSLLPLIIIYRGKKYFQQQFGAI